MEPKEFKSSVPMDFDGDGDIDIVDADSSSGNLYLIKKFWFKFFQRTHTGSLIRR